MSPATRIYAGNVQSVEAEAGLSEIVTEKELFRYISPYGEVIDYYFGNDGKHILSKMVRKTKLFCL